MAVPKSKQKYSIGTPTTTSTTTDSNDDEVQFTQTLQNSRMDGIDEDMILRNICRGKPFPMWLFEDMEPEYVTAVPGDIDGLCFYSIKANASNWTKVTADLRHFNMLTSSHSGYDGERRIGKCLGSFVCRNTECPFVKTSKNSVPNKVSWRIPHGRWNVHICTICETTGNREGCGARKMVEFDDASGIARVYHIGTHKCCPQVDMKRRNSLIKQCIMERNLFGPAKEVNLQEIGKFIEAGNMDLAASEAECWVDKWAVKRQMDAQTPEAGADHNSFDAVGLLKETRDQCDKYYIYNIGNKNLSDFGELVGTDHVFKLSAKMAEIALSMNDNAPDNILQLENAYFDSTHTRVYGFKTFGLWVMHPAMKQILCLASMEIRTEKSTHIAVFFKLFNRMLSEIKGEPVMFMPHYFVCDEGGQITRRYAKYMEMVSAKIEYEDASGILSPMSGSMW